MQLLYSNNSLIKPDNSFADAFIDLMGDADHLKLATGYISEDSLLFLLENLNYNKALTCDLVIGMHMFDGITRTQYETAIELAAYLDKNHRGSVSVCAAYPNHSKFYSFCKDSNPYASLVGSANITQLIPTRQRNLCVVISETKLLLEIDACHKKLQQSCNPILEWKPKNFIQKNSLLKDCIGVKQVAPEEYSAILKTQRKTSFKLPLKASKKSNLNVGFGKGRSNTRKGIVRPRSWYEFEVIVDRKINRLRGYPKNREFTVYTDDGWAFECKTQGDYAKNFRSIGGLSILGMWVKGRMQDAGVVKPGEFITSEMVKKFGKKDLLLTATNNPKIWLLNF